MGITTISITEDQKDELDELKLVDGESYKSVVGRLLGDTESNSDFEKMVEELKNEMSMANEPGVECDVDGLYDKVDKVLTLAEQTRDNTEAIQNRMGR